jgi:hypothetical protein
VGRRYVPTRPWKLVDAGAGPFLTTPDGPVWAPSGIIGAFQVEMRFAMSDWTPAGGVLVARSGFTDGDLAWSVEVMADGRPRGNYYPAGTLASRVGTVAAQVPPFTDGQTYGLRVGFLSDLLGVASAYRYEVQTGAAGWRRLGPDQLSAGVVVPHDTSEAVRVGEPAEVLELETFRVYPLEGPRRLDAGIGGRPSGASWLDRGDPSVTWTLGAASFARSSRSAPYAGR